MLTDVFWIFLRGNKIEVFVKKKAVSVIGVMCGIAILLSGCETTNSSIPYQASTENVIAIQQGLKSSKVSVADIGLGPDVSEHLMCRLNGDVIVSPGRTLSQYIKAAFQQELFMAQAFSPSGTAIQGRIDALSFSSTSPADWKITMRVSSPVSPGYTVSIDYPFDTSWAAGAACKNVADAFAPAVQELLHKVVTNPQFASLSAK